MRDGRVHEAAVASCCTGGDFACFKDNHASVRVFLFGEQGCP